MLGRPRRSPSLPATFVDEEDEQRKAGLLMAAVLAALISGWYSYQELKYAFWGESIEATVIRTYEFTVPTRYGRSKPRLGIEYQFDDAAGHTRTDKDWVRLPSDLRQADTVPVQSLRGVGGNSRLAANRSYLGPIVFLGCLAVAGYGFVAFIYEARTPIRRRGRRR